MTRLLFHHSVPTPTGLQWVLLVVGALGLLLVTIWLADDKRSVVARNVGAALVLVLSVLTVPAVLCCWCPPDPEWWQCVMQPWCCVGSVLLFGRQTSAGACSACGRPTASHRVNGRWVGCSRDVVIGSDQATSWRRLRIALLQSRGVLKVKPFGIQR